MLSDDDGMRYIKIRLSRLKSNQGGGYYDGARTERLSVATLQNNTVQQNYFFRSLLTIA